MENENKINEVVNENEDTSLEAGIVPALRDTEIVKEVKNSFLDYAMSVIVARALPDVRDGLKPVHRRCIYGMYEAGYTPDKPFVKSAKIVGDVMGKYHPHGDAAIYNTIVRLAQKFSMRYTLAEGHGNFGSMDGDEAAAMRYTECRMSKIALEMVKDIDCETVNFVPNYDGTLEEPAVLPSKIPNLLINGSDGIAVGMATKMPPHNLKEIIEGIVALAKNKDITIDELLKIVKGPDFPTGGIIYGLGGVRDAYTTGKGTFKLRGKCRIEESSNGKGKIIITEIPYQVNKATLVQKIGDLVKNKEIEGIELMYQRLEMNGSDISKVDAMERDSERARSIKARSDQFFKIDHPGYVAGTTTRDLVRFLGNGTDADVNVSDETLDAVYQAVMGSSGEDPVNRQENGRKLLQPLKDSVSVLRSQMAQLGDHHNARPISQNDIMVRYQETAELYKKAQITRDIGSQVLGSGAIQEGDPGYEEFLDDLDYARSVCEYVKGLNSDGKGVEAGTKSPGEVRSFEDAQEEFRQKRRNPR